MSYLARLKALEAARENAPQTHREVTAKTAKSPPASPFGTFGSTFPEHIPGNSPAEWRHGITLLRTIGRPHRFGPRQWDELLAGAEALLMAWGAKAAALGWETLDLFGCSSSFARRLDRDGLTMLLGGRPVIAMTAETATISNRIGRPNIYRRRPKDGAVPMWRATA